MCNKNNVSLQLKAQMNTNMHLVTRGKAHHHQMISGLPQECEGMWSCALTYLASVIHRPRGVNPNTFLDSSNRFVRLRKNSLPVSVVICLHADLLALGSFMHANGCWKTWQTFSFIDFKDVVSEVALHAASNMIIFMSGWLQDFT